MTPREVERRCGIVTLEADRPQEVERAVLADGVVVDSRPGRVRLSTHWCLTDEEGSLLREGSAAICVDLEEPPLAYVSAEGRAHVSRDQAELLRWATAIGGRYMGADHADEFGARNAVLDELQVRLTPDRVIALAEISD